MLIIRGFETGTSIDEQKHQQGLRASECVSNWAVDLDQQETKTGYIWPSFELLDVQLYIPHVVLFLSECLVDFLLVLLMGMHKICILNM